METSLPSVHFPTVAPPHTTYRDIFAEYGQFDGYEYNEEGNTWICQKTHNLPNLFAKTPTIPLIPPNNVRFPFKDACSGNLLKNRMSLRYSLVAMKIIERKKRKRTTVFKAVDYDAVFNEMENYDIKQLLPTTLMGPETFHKLCESEWFLRAKFFPGEDRCHVVSTHEAVGLKSPICGIQSTTCHGQDYVGVRGQKDCTMFELIEENNSPKLKKVVDGKSSAEITSFFPSPYVPGEALVTTNQRRVSLLSPEKSLPLIESIDHRFTCHDPWLQAYFGATPRSVITTDRTAVQLFDLRCSTTRTQQDIFVLPNSNVMEKEKIMVSAPYRHNCFHHLIATDYTLMCFDERFTANPVIQWNPCLRSPPQYLEVVRNVTSKENEDMILIGTQDTLDVLCYPFTLGREPKPLAQGLGPAWRLSRIDDFPAFPVLDGCRADSIAINERLSETSLIGLCGLVTSGQPGFSALQLSACGDLFCQTYRPGDALTDRTYSAGPGSCDMKLSPDVQETCSTWLTQLQDFVDATADEIADNIPHRRLDVSNLFKSINKNAYPHIQCGVCMPKGTTQTQAEVEREGMDEYCLACGSDLKVSKPLHDFVKKGDKGLFSFTSDRVDLFEKTVKPPDISRYKDVFSRLLVKQWNDEQEDISELLKERDKVHREMKMKQREKKFQNKEQSSEEERERSPSPQRSEGQESSVEDPSSPVQTERDLDVNTQESVPAKEPPVFHSPKPQQSFQQTFSQIESSMKKLMDYESSPRKPRTDEVAGFRSQRQTPLRRSHSAESLFSQVSLTSQFVGTSKAINDSIQRILDYESESEGTPSARHKGKKTVEKWVSTIDSYHEHDPSAARALGLEKYSQRGLGMANELEKLGLSTLVTPMAFPHVPSGRLSLKKSKVTKSHFADTQSSSQHEELFINAGQSFENLSLCSVPSFPGDSEAPPLGPSQDLADDPSFTSASQFTMLRSSQLNKTPESVSQSKFKTPTSKKKKRKLVTGF